MSNSLFKSSPEQAKVNKVLFAYREKIMNVPTNDNAKNEIDRIFADAKAEITKNHGTSADITSLQDAVKKKMAMLESHVVVKSESSFFGSTKTDKPSEPAAAATKSAATKSPAKK